MDSEKQMLGDWARAYARIGWTQPHWEAVQFRRAFRMSKPALNKLLGRYCASIAKRNTIMRNAIPAAKRLAIFLDWDGSESPHQHLARTYDISKTAVCNIIHDVVFIPCK